MKKVSILKLAVAILWSNSITVLNTTAQSYTLYGATQSGGTYNEGVIYSYLYPSGPISVVVNFNDTNGSVQRGCLILASDGNIYGMTSMGGTSNEGVLYRINPRTLQDTILINFNGANGSNPLTGLMQANNGLLYGVTSEGGASNMGLCFSYNLITKTQTQLFSFNDTNGERPTGHLIQASNGLLYGHTTLGGIYGLGTIFYYNIGTGNDSVVYNFNGLDGNQPRGFMQASNGLIYGNTYLGGDSDRGVLYSFNTLNSTYNVIINFDGINGIYPSSDAEGLLQASNGLIYGITQMGGTYNKGLLYSYNPNTNGDSILTNFSPGDTLGSDPYASGYTQIPRGPLVFPVDSGGVHGFGTLISYDPINGNFRKLFDFNGTLGAYPTTGLIAIANKCSNTICNANRATLAFPDPSLGVISISAENPLGNCEIQIFNMLGEEIYQGRYIEKSEINLLNQPKGIYLYSLTSTMDGSEVSSGKFILEK